jgi:hypothetical protein
LDGENDDFGDFGAAPSAPAGETKPSNGEDDEFGDFGEADESKAEHKAGEDFGDFSDFNEADARAAQLPTPTPSHQDAPPLNTGPQFERAKLVFSKIQSTYAFDQIEIKDGNSSGDQMTLQSFIVSFNGSTNAVLVSLQTLTFDFFDIGFFELQRPCGNRRSKSHRLVHAEGFSESQRVSLKGHHFARRTWALLSFDLPNRRSSSANRQDWDRSRQQTRLGRSI